MAGSVLQMPRRAIRAQKAEKAMKQLIFAALVLVALGVFTRTALRYVGVLMLGSSDPRPRFDQPLKRLAFFFVQFIGQKKVGEPQIGKAASSYHHLFIFWGFLVITIGTAELILSGVFPVLTFANLIGHTAASALHAVIDICNLLVLLMVVYALYRRLVVKPRLIPITGDALVILGAIGLLMITHFIYHGFGMVGVTGRKARFLFRLVLGEEFGNQFLQDTVGFGAHRYLPF